MHKLKQRLKEQWPLIALILAITFAPPLQQFVGVPLWLTHSVFGLAYVGWFVLHARQIWRQAARDKKALEEKQALADAQLFGCKPM
jgi:hypothetical protein